jgi:hypothetical protein
MDHAGGAPSGKVATGRFDRASVWGAPAAARLEETKRPGVHGPRGAWPTRCCYLGDLVDVFGLVVKLQKHSRMKNGFGRFIAH